MVYELIKQLSDAHGVSGFEDSIKVIIRKELTGYVDEFREDELGNLIAVKKGSDFSVMIASHMDEIGLMVQYIDEKGFIKFVGLGGWYNPTLHTQRVILHGTKGPVHGIIGAKPVHIMSPERILFPEATILCDHIIRLMTTVIEGLVIRQDRITQNLNMLHGINMAESVMIELTRQGMGRQEAHEVIRVKSMEALAAKRSLSSLLSETPEVTKILSPGEIETLLNPDNYLGTSVLQVERVVAKLKLFCV